MRFAIGATVALAAAVVRADDASSSAAESSSSTSVAKPTFTVSTTIDARVSPR
jgi:calnexin